ncbi:DUF2513 domain-containing protein [Shewanella algae]|uniref:DUF2513 domain-containing protein n=1 Tax=Shewanella algae TaxID=38313 RepID=UPI001AAD7BEE|nr:DUF2513 domain-containing protein [Shewanella algae]MBO2650464.1 DUF2513 domain-containing protein [Shewanella algae]
MKRDMELIRAIILKVQDDSFSIKMEGYTEDEVKYHTKMAIEAGLVEGKVQNNFSNRTNIPSSVIAKDLTWSGHDLAESIASDTNWNKVKDYAKESGKILSIEVIKQSAKMLFQTF